MFPFSEHPTIRQTPLPFVKPVKVFSVSSSGGVYRDDSLGVCIKVPKGAVPEGNVLRLEVGMCLYGPFKFPSGTTPIAPVLMLCPQQEIELKEPVLVTLPHIINRACTADVDGLGIKVVEAGHQSPLPQFEDIDAHIIFESDGDEEYAKFSLSHFRFISLRAESKREKALQFGYCICPMYPIQTKLAKLELKYHLAVTYCSLPWREVSKLHIHAECAYPFGSQALKEQFLRVGFKLMNGAIKRFTSSECGTVQGEIVNRDELKDWEVDLEFGDLDGKKGKCLRVRCCADRKYCLCCLGYYCGFSGCLEKRIGRA